MAACDLNDETFGGFADDTGASRDFDFAGSTSRFLGNEAERVELVDGEVVLGHSLTVRVSGRHGCLRTAASLETTI
jgi:hypothetical protein